MGKICFLLLFFSMTLTFSVSASTKEPYETDIIKTSADDLKITFIGHGTLMFTFGTKIIYVDPYTNVADFAKFPKADVVLITHEHSDHLDLKALELVRTEKTKVVLTEPCSKQVKNGIIMKNGDVQTVSGLKIETIPAYNLIHKRDNGQPFHPKGVGNGYIITFGNKRVYVAGDTENTPEMKSLREIDCAFLPMNLPYTMTPEMVVDTATAFWPKILYPYHFGDTDTSNLIKLLQDQKGIEVRIRNMK